MNTLKLALAAGLLTSIHGGLALAGAPADPAIGIRILVTDRDLDTVWLLRDANNNGIIDANEVSLFFNAANAAGTPPAGNPTAMAIRKDGVVIIGDQSAARVHRIWDRDLDGNAQGPLESSLFATTPAPWSFFGFVTGVGFDSTGRIQVANAGNALFPNDGIYELRDLNNDGDANDNVGGLDEAIPYCNAGPMGPGNTAYSPQELLFQGNVGLMRESNGTFQGIWRFQDNNANGDCNDAGEFTAFLVAGNLSGVTLSSGFCIEPDYARQGSGSPFIAPCPAVYMNQTVTGGIDQIVRAQDLNGDGDANDADEAQLVYVTAESGFSLLDMICLPDGSLLLLDNSGKKIFRLQDLNHDGVFANDNSERTVFWANDGAVPITDMRKMSVLPVRCAADIANDAGDAGFNGRTNEGDYNCFFQFFFLDAPDSAPADIADDAGNILLGGDGHANEGDYNCFFQHFFENCP